MTAARPTRSLLSVSLDVSVHRTVRTVSVSPRNSGAGRTDTLPAPTIRAEGPALWLAQRADAHLWILPVPAALPGAMPSQLGEAGRIASVANTLLARPKVDISGAWQGSGLRALTRLRRVAADASIVHRIADGRTLRDLLPAEAHAEWRAAVDHSGIASVGLEHLRPFFALKVLRQAIMARHGLESPKAFCKELRRTSRAAGGRYQVPRAELTIDIPLNGDSAPAHAVLDDTTQFAAQVQRLRRLPRIAVAQAQAWAQGDAVAMYGDDTSGDTLVDAPAAALELDALRLDAWLNAVDAATGNASITLAVLDIEDAFDGNGYIKGLRERGFTFQPA